MKVSDYIALFLEQKGIGHVFELSGGMITHMLDSINQKTAIKIISMHHEQGAAFAADAYGRVSGKPGVAFATSGPGATNLLTGMGSCYFDSSPAVFITGQVNRHEQKGDRNIRQLGFQETDIVSMALPITKMAVKVLSPEEVPELLYKAFEVAISGRPGPVLIDIPMDVQRAEINVTEFRAEKIKPLVEDFNKQFDELSQAIFNCKKPLILVGRGVRAAFAENEFNDFIKLTKIPVVTSLLAIDILPFNHDQRVGFIGSYGNRWANIVLGECDLLIVLGSRLDIRQTGADTKFFENRPIFHVDCEKGEINNRIKNCSPFQLDVKIFLEEFNVKFQNSKYEKNEDWFDYIYNLKQKWPDTKEVNTVGINPNSFMHTLSQNSLESGAYLADVGSHQMWAAQSTEIKNNQLFLTSAGMGAMGFALPASIGASLALQGKPVVAIIGDGCMQINIQELQTIIRNQLPIKIVVMNNQNLGMIRQFQDSYFESRYQSTWWGYSAPNFEKISIAYGIDAKTISTEAEVLDAVKWLWAEKGEQKPKLLQVMIDPRTNTYPKIAFGKPITEMEPMSQPLDMEGT